VFQPAVSTRAVTATAFVLAVFAGGPIGRAQVFAPALACWDDVRLFPSLSSGNFDYCRSHLRYVPGALECFQVVDRVCLVWVPGSTDWTEARSTRARVSLPCPDGPEPPVCRRLDLQ
jgi:hypothetical protein